MSPLGDDKGGWGKRLTGIHQMGHSIHLIIKIFLWWGHPLMIIHMGYKYLHTFCPFREVRLSTYLFPKFPCYSSSNHVPSKSLAMQPDHWQQPMNCYITTWLAISLSKQSEQPSALPKFCPAVRFHFTTVLQRCPREGLSCCSRPLWGVACISRRTVCKPGREDSSLPLSTDCRELLMGPLVQTGREEAAQSEWGPWASGLLLHVTCVFRACSGLITYTPFPLGNRTYGLVGQITPSSWLATQVKL